MADFCGGAGSGNRTRVTSLEGLCRRLKTAENREFSVPLGANDARTDREDRQDLPQSYRADRPRLLDLFCGAGGAAMGYHQAGFDVVGVDINPQPRYPFEFVQGDALALDREFVASFDAIHASPPCQAHTAMRTMHNAREHPDLVAATRAMLTASGRPWAMENVVGAPLDGPITLCGTMFGLGVEDAELQRHRLFEMSHPPVFVPACQHGSRDTIGIYGGHARNRRRARTIGIYGEGARDSRRKFDKGVPGFTTAQARIAMGAEWMTLAELCQAIPPAYTRFIGEQLLAHLAPRPHNRGAVL